jgi:outer membrane protein insertion porin family
VGPQFVGSDGTLYPTGGNALLLGGAELRYDIRRSLQLAGFLDLGNVYPEIRDLALSDLRRSAGVGVRYRTPIGPLRLDWGYVLDRRPGESPSHLHLTIGHAF